MGYMLESLVWLLLLFGLPLGYFTVYEWYTGERHHMLQRPEQRTYLFEDEQGEKRNPFGSVSDGAKTSDEREYTYEPAEFD